MKTKQWIMIGGVLVTGVALYFLFTKKTGDNSFNYKDRWKSEPPANK